MGPVLGVFRTLWTDLRGPLYRNAVYLMGNTAVGLATGFLFWVLVAQLYPTDDIGRAAAAISLLGFLGGLANLGLGIGVVRYLPDAGSRGTNMVNTCLTVSALAGLGLAVAFLAGIDLWGARLFFLRADALFLVTFLIAAALMAVAPIIDGAFVAGRRSQFVLLRQSVHAVRLPLPVVLAPFLGAFGIFGSWALAVLLAVLVGALWFMPRIVREYRLRPTVRGRFLGRLFRFSFGNYIANVIGLAPIGLLPLLILNVLGETPAGQFYVAYSMATLLFVIPGAASLSLFAEGSQPGAQFGRDARKAIQLVALLLAPAILAFYFYGDVVLRVYGGAFSEQGFYLLQLLALSGGFVAINSVYITKLRVEERIRPIIGLAVLTSSLTIGISYALLPGSGIAAVGVAQLVAQGAGAAYASVAWLLERGRAAPQAAGPRQNIM